MIVIHAYRAAWSTEFLEIRADLANVLGDSTQGIAHIGSTAIPGLGSKDIIDVQVAVDRLSADLVTRLKAAAYEFVARHDRDHVPAGAAEVAAAGNWAKLYFRQRPGQRACHIHVRVQGSANHRYALLFRDYLRAHPAARDTLDALKRELARLHGDDADAYYAIKDPIYDLIWLSANDWALTSAWRLEDSPQL
jgi:GrpB-like predicted nucleotidyltransferase (UPF0157 family)